MFANGVNSVHFGTRGVFWGLRQKRGEFCGFSQKGWHSWDLCRRGDILKIYERVEIQWLFAKAVRLSMFFQNRADGLFFIGVRFWDVFTKRLRFFGFVQRGDVLGDFSKR